jgi:hypothetical protein
MHVVYRGPSEIDGSPIVGIVTTKSENRKTGPMDQLWILREDIPPLTALAHGLDVGTCGRCPFKGDHGKKRSCYVNVAKAPTTIWGAYSAIKAGLAPFFAEGFYPNQESFRIRLGAYGDPAALPFRVIKMLACSSDGWCGYTHQWRYCDQRFKSYLMASVSSLPEFMNANNMGWRCFITVPVGASPELALTQRHFEVTQCPSNKGAHCISCLACCGNSARYCTDEEVFGRNIWIEAHGTGAKHINGRW